MADEKDKGKDKGKPKGDQPDFTDDDIEIAERVLDRIGRERAAGKKSGR